jgi:hypothetical protein
VAIERLTLTEQGSIRYALKTPYRDGSTHVIFEPLDFLARLASLVPRPRVNLTRFHAVFAPNHGLRAQIVPAQRRRGSPQAQGNAEGRSVVRPVAMSWARQRPQNGADTVRKNGKARPFARSPLHIPCNAVQHGVE